MNEAEFLAVIAAILTAGQAASPEPERLSADEAISDASELIMKSIEHEFPSKGVGPLEES